MGAPPTPSRQWGRAAREAVRRNLPVRLVHAPNWSPNPAGSDPASVVRRQKGRGVLRTAEDRIAHTGPGARLTDELADGPATAALVRAADTAELLVLGSRGLSGFTGFLLGSVAQNVVARATGPVVLVEAGEQAEDERLPDQDGNASARTPYRDVVLGIDPGDACDEVIEIHLAHCPVAVVAHD